jgi:hypothetical protein
MKRMKKLSALPVSIQSVVQAGGSLLAALVILAAPLRVGAQSATVTGYNGTQTFVTAVGKDPAEPNACGVNGGSSYWFTYQPPADGIAAFNTSGSTYDSVLGIYVDNGQNLGYSSLVSVTCNDDCAVSNKTSCVNWNASSKTNYYIMLDGKNGAIGTAYLTYSLNAAPNITAPTNTTVKEDSNTIALPFKIWDRETAATSLALSATSSNTTLLPATNIVFGGSSSNRTVTLTPVKYQFGTSLITLTTTDGGGASRSTNFLFTVTFANHTPKTTNDIVTRQPTKGITIARTFPTRNDWDPDAQALTVSAIAATSKNGVALTLNTTNIIYAASSLTNQDYFTYTLSDGTATATGTNYINVSTNGVLVVP